MPPLDSGEHDGQLFQAAQIVAGEEPVDVRQRRTHAARERLVVRVPLRAD